MRPPRSSDAEVAAFADGCCPSVKEECRLKPGPESVMFAKDRVAPVFCMSTRRRSYPEMGAENATNCLLKLLKEHLFNGVQVQRIYL